MRFRLNSVIITGATSGIGEALAYQLAAEGAWLTLAARDEERLEAVVRRCRILGSHMRVRAEGVTTDVKDERQCKALVEAAVGHYARVDTLINNAGIIMSSRFDELEVLDVMRQLMDVNYFGSVYCTYFALPYLKQVRGRLIGISSFIGRVGLPTYSGYAASKFAMRGFFDSLRSELKESGVSVTMIYPNAVDTGFHARGPGSDGRPLGETPRDDPEAMSPEKTAKIILHAAANRQREKTLTLRAKLAVFLKTFAPEFVDEMARWEIEKRDKG